MPLFLAKNSAILYLHVPKCGGTSVAEMFTSNGYSAQFQMRGLPAQAALTTSPQHQTCSALKPLVNFSNLSAIFTLARNPYQRLASEFNWSFRDIASRDRPDYSEWVIGSLSQAKQDPLYADSHFRPAIDFLDVCIPAKVFRLEDGLGLIAEFFLGQLRTNTRIAIERKHDSRSMPNSELNLELSPEALTVVNAYYYYDFMALGYRMSEVDNCLRGNDWPQLVPDETLLAKSKIVSKWRLDTLAGLESVISARLKLAIGDTEVERGRLTCVRGYAKERLQRYLKNWPQ